MSERQTTLEMIAPTVEEAISKGLEELGVPEDSVEVEILDEGGRGLLGLGARQARVRLTVRQPTEDTTALPQASEEAIEEYASASPVVEVTDLKISETDDPALTIARETVMELLEKMKISASVTARYLEDSETGPQEKILVDVHGKDLSILIGRRATTINALQYIARIIVSKELERGVNLVVDVEGYRERRERQLRHLARQMAEQAIQTGRRQYLEPMPANERRIIHLELRDNPLVTTESIGEEPRRKVTIKPVTI